MEGVFSHDHLYSDLTITGRMCQSHPYHWPITCNKTRFVGGSKANTSTPEWWHKRTTGTIGVVFAEARRQLERFDNGVFDLNILKECNIIYVIRCSFQQNVVH